MRKIEYLTPSCVTTALTILALLFAHDHAHAQDAPCVDASGEWTLSMSMQGQSMAATLTLSQEGCEVTGTIRNQMDQISITEGKAEGGTLSFVLNFPLPSGELLALSFKAEIEENSLEGLLTSPQGEVAVSGERKVGTF